MSKDCSSALSKTFVEFTQHSSIHGYKYITDSKCNLYEKIIWIIVHIIAAYAVVNLVLYSWREFMDNPTVTTLENPNLPISKVPYPGVAICSTNKISKRRAMDFSRQFSKLSDVPEDTLFNLTKLFGKLYDYQREDDKELTYFQSLLDLYDIRESKGSFDTYNRLKELIVDCEELISDCKWNGIERNCSDMFTFDTTMDGHCCIFNYVPSAFRNKSKIIKENRNKSLTSEISGYDYGLTITVNTNKSDYLYTTIPSLGASVQLFNPGDYPDTTSGGLIEKVIPVGVEMYVRIEAIKIFTSNDVKQYPIKKRKCVFNNEKKTLFGKLYSYSDCILQCKLKSIIALCLCIPHQYIHAIGEQRQPQCNLADLICLDKYKGKWNQMYPFDFEGEETSREREDSLVCPECVPMCSDTLYSVKHDYHEIYVNQSTPKESLNYSIVHVFFEKSVSSLYKQEVVYYWFEIVSMFGGTCSLIIGVSLVSLLEFIYFFTIRLRINTKPVDRKRNSKQPSTHIN